MTKTTGTFKRGTNAGTFVCAVCGDRRQRGNSGDNDELCIPCYDEAGEINSHADGMHGANAYGPSASCPDCTGSPERGSDVWKAERNLDKQVAEAIVEGTGIPAKLAGFSQTKQVALVRCWIGASRTPEAKARWTAILAAVEGQAPSTPVAEPKPVQTGITCSFCGSYNVTEQHVMDHWKHNAAVTPVSHDGTIRSMYVTVHDAEGTRLGTARLAKLAGPVQEYMKLAQRSHRMSHPGSSDDLVRTATTGGVPCIKTRGCQAYRSEVSRQIRSLAGHVYPGCTVRAI